MKVVSVLTPMGEQCSAAYTASLAGLMLTTMNERPANLGGLSYMTWQSSVLPASRNVLAAYALEHGATHLLWIDSDMAFPGDMLLRWLTRNEPILGINATNRRPPLRTTAQIDGVPLQTTEDSRGFEKVTRMGFGVALIAAEVFRALEMPWFDFEWVPEAGAHMGEDFYFCEKARAAGFEMLIDHDLSKQVKHVGSFGFGPLQVEMGEA